MHWLSKMQFCDMHLYFCQRKWRRIRWNLAENRCPQVVKWSGKIGFWSGKSQGKREFLGCGNPDLLCNTGDRVIDYKKHSDSISLFWNLLLKFYPIPCLYRQQNLWSFWKCVPFGEIKQIRQGKWIWSGKVQGKWFSSGNPDIEYQVLIMNTVFYIGAFPFICLP